MEWVGLTGWRALDAKGLLLPVPSNVEGSNHGSPPPPPWGVLGRMLLPTSTLAVSWSVFIHAFDGLYTAFVLPVTIAFSAHTIHGVLGVSSTVAGLVYLIDVLFNLQTGIAVTFLTQRALVLDPSTVAWWYATRGTALVDLLAIGPLPLELALWLAPSAPHSWSSALPLVLMLRLARLVHVWRFLVDAQFNGIQLYRGFGLYSVVTPTALLLANLTFTTATVVNFLGCLWVWTAHMEGTAHSWLSDVGGQDLSDASAQVQWLAAVFFALTTVSSTGYGDIVARTTLERCIALGFLGVGVIFFSFLVSSFTTMMSTASQEAKRAAAFHTKLEAVDEWMHTNKLPRTLRHKIREYYCTYWGFDQEASGYSVQQIADLPTTLREDVAVFLTNDVLDSSRVFGSLSAEERRYLATRLHPMVLPPGQELFHQGQEAGSVLLLQQGTLELQRYQRVVQVLQAPAFIGEMAMLVDVLPDARVREVTCRSLSPCVVWRLAVEDLRQAAAVYPTLYGRLRGALEAELNEALAALRKVDPSLATTLQGVGSEQGIEEAIRTLLAAEQQELGGTSSGLFRAPPGAPEHATPPPPFTVHADLHTQTRTDGATARERSARAWRRATRAALYQPLLEPEPPAPTLQPVHSIDAHVRPGAAALYALGLMKQGAKGRQ